MRCAARESPCLRRATPPPPRRLRRSRLPPMTTPTTPYDGFRRFAHNVATKVGAPWPFGAALATVVAWAVSGPLFHYSDTWQLTINTGTTIVTFLMVFLIQATQNRDAEAIQIKLDEIIRALEGAHNAMLDLEEMDEDDLVKLHANYLKLAGEA